MINVSSPMPATQPTFLALGDSYTICESVPESDRWPVQLVAMLRKETRDIADPMIIAKTGWTTDELSAAIDAAKIDEKRFDLVTLLIGVNNQYRGRPTDEYRDQFRALLTRAITFARGDAKHVIVVSIPDWGVTRFAEGRDRAQIAREIDLFNEIARAETKKVGAHYVDVTPVSREFRSELADDGLHPSGAMYKRWAELALPVARTILREGK
jgi:lysophospholipase L1-like esterase